MPFSKRTKKPAANIGDDEKRSESRPASATIVTVGSICTSSEPSGNPGVVYSVPGNKSPESGT
jgi:hypothetical protein